MIANQTFGDDFGDLGDYLRRGRGRVDPAQRVGWIECRNMPTERMEIAERIREGTASLSYTKAMIDRKIGRDEPAGPPADEVAAMRAEIAQLREELATARAA